ncbi:PpsA5 [Thecamonas trahens ATCC 50062]|uniref:pyruvate, water dikinase n=1 Tax=Thecamonas trahens ATCC 50062 TaxID=461836 RepID=A0A0L0D7J8_THETB|nr:PpsA5 [Thecamonas trahens ATCC 50062]KNC48329.1 PpsA5 [Thecamonas trahens ATCC 50062]|eukprot:XP_013758896.1 PpsA5 [Thecamonas trahens ATCC 50062]
MTSNPPLISWFKDLTIADVPLVGGKNASLGEMYRELSSKGVVVPNGFAITAYAYRCLLAANPESTAKLNSLLEELDIHDMDVLASSGKAIRQLIKDMEFPHDLTAAIKDAYAVLSAEYEGAESGTDVAVRSSATAEDLPNASFAGQQETFLNIHGASELLHACRRCFASLYTNRAIVYRVENGFDHSLVALSIGVQKMVRSDQAASGVMFSIDTETACDATVLITGAYGLGENVVQGAVNPDEWLVHKQLLRDGYEPIVQRNVGAKKIKMVYALDAAAPVRNVVVPKSERVKLCLDDADVLALARMAVAIEDHYSAKAGCRRPMDIEWAKDGPTGKLFVVQARPETVHSQRSVTKIVTHSLVGNDVAPSDVLTRGAPVGDAIGSGTAKILRSASQLAEFKPGDVLVTGMTDPDWVPVMKLASGIVTARGGRTCHAAIISREMGIPCIVGTGDALTAIPNGTSVTVCCTGSSYAGAVLSGIKASSTREVDIGALPALPSTATQVMVNLASPSLALASAFLPVAGVGLAREEFIIANHIRVHPLALIGFPHNKAGADPDTADAVAALLGSRYADCPEAFSSTSWPKALGSLPLLSTRARLSSASPTLSRTSTRASSAACSTSRSRRTRCLASAARRGTTTRATARRLSWSALLSPSCATSWASQTSRS